MDLLAIVLAALIPPGLDWRKDYEAARTEARDKGRLILLHFSLEGRPLCRTMDEETFASDDVIRIAGEKFIPVRADADAQSGLFNSTIGGRGGLATCIVDAGGDVISALHGYAGPQTFLRFMERGEAGYAQVRSARGAAEKSPGSLLAQFALAEAYRAADSLRRAEECYHQVVDLSAGKKELDEASLRAAASSHERLARLRIMRGKNLDARRHLEEARRLDPDGRRCSADRLMLTEALTFVVERKHLEAAEVLQRALQRYPDSGEADHMLYALGFALHQVSQDQPALEALERVQRQFPQSPWTAAVREQIEHIRNPQPDHAH